MSSSFQKLEEHSDSTRNTFTEMSELSQSPEQKVPEFYVPGDDHDEEVISEPRGSRQKYSAEDVMDDSEDYFFDMCMVFKVGNPKKQLTITKTGNSRTEQIDQRTFFAQRAAAMLSRLEHAGLKTSCYKDVGGTQVFCLLGASETRLKKEADRQEYELLLDPTNTIEVGKKLGMKLALCTEDPKYPDIKHDDWRGNYAPYQKPDPKKEIDKSRIYTLYHHRNGNDSIFRDVDRIKLTVGIAEADTKWGGGGLKPSADVSDAEHPLLAFYPLHHRGRLQELSQSWLHYTALFTQPLDGIRDYFGEQIAIYFAFLRYYSYWLVPVAVLGIVTFATQEVKGTVDVPMLPFFAFAVCVWATLQLEYWKRKEASLRFEWGMTNFHIKEQPRPNFVGEFKVSSIDGQLHEIFPFWKQVLKICVSQGVVWTLILLVLACVFGVFVFRKWLQTDLFPSKENTYNAYVATVLGSVCNAVLIMVMNLLWGKIARKLTDWENHMTDTAYENNLIAKTFLFKFVNSYNSLFYIAFVKQYDAPAVRCTNIPGDERNCLQQLKIQLGIIFGLQMVVNNVIEVLKPKVFTCLKVRAKAKAKAAAAAARAASEVSAADLQTREEGEEGDSVVLSEEEDPKVTEPEEEFVLEPFDTTFWDFDEIVIQFGYCSLFVVAFPLTPLLALVSNMIEMFLDAHKLCKLTRRPEPRGAGNIGTWYFILNIMGFIAVITNCLLVCLEARSSILLGKGGVLYRMLSVKDPCTSLVDKTVVIDATCVQESQPLVPGNIVMFFLVEHLLFLLKFTLAFFIPDEDNSTYQRHQRQQVIVNAIVKEMVVDGPDEEEFDLAANLKEKTHEATNLMTLKYFNVVKMPEQPLPIVEVHSINHSKHVADIDIENNA
mmetsp:Transcript_7357/g.13946  ORF Transcript_7357/g.13946 Transcript_7357/m.13946 type:complete len:883 (+) Transcript_7357:60-2708(+)